MSRRSANTAEALVDPTVAPAASPTTLPAAPAANDPGPRRVPTTDGRHSVCDIDGSPIDPADYLPFVRKVASRMARQLPSHVSLDDLVGAGTVGLLDALRRFSPEHDTKFETFAEFRIKGAILDELRRYDMMARNARLATKKIARNVQRLTGRLGRPPTEEEIAESLAMTVRDYRALVQRLGSVRVVSLDELGPAANDDRPARFEPESRLPGPEEWTADRQMHAKVHAAIDHLPDRQREIVRMYYFEGMTLRQIGEVFGVTESRICQIVGDAHKKLRRIMHRESSHGQ
ncbi:MAG: FliA/WhiG family RNA polymerase sigma factor [Deltaproteobacteria bacterium]|nr:MAG: FliA/WhiG family RNA polymerase sigma factor [Deltaproteobacteria bacterium]